MITNPAALQGMFASLEQLRAVAVHLFATTNRPPRRPADKAADAEQLRTFALEFATSDPAFAAELLAAADRHERAS